MLLSNTAIRRHLQLGNIVIDPFVEENLGTVSYDVCLGPWYYRERCPAGRGGSSSSPQHRRIYNFYDGAHVERVWGSAPSYAIPARDFARQANITLEGIAPDELVIPIDPGETILCHTEEFIGGRGGIITTMMKARSSMGRNFIEICKCAGWGDVGYTNRWTMEVTNNSRWHTIPLVVGRRVAQIVFFEVEPIENHDLDYTRTGKYQSCVDIEELRQIWVPQQMLPKMHRDREAERARALSEQVPKS